MLLLAVGTVRVIDRTHFRVDVISVRYTNCAEVTPRCLESRDTVYVTKFVLIS